MSDSKLHFPMTQIVVEKGLLQDHPLSLIDVGASGGIEDHWRIFGNNLIAHGFEPLIAECERLNQRALQGVRYYPYFVGKDEGPASPSFLENRKADSITPFGRSSSLRAEVLQGKNYMEAKTPGQKLVFAGTTVTLDHFINERPEIEEIDFIKIDTDGSDYDVLLGSKSILEKFNVLGLKFEANFHTTSSMFCELDQFCRSRGYSLFDVVPQRYSRAQLPLKFVASSPATTIAGQVLWADVIYFRDPCSAPWKDVRFETSKLLKLACIYELYGFPDCAAEVMIAFRESFDRSTGGATERLLDALTPRLNHERYSFREYNEQFEKNLPLFFNGGTSAEYFKKQLDEVYASRSWKVTAPLRWLAYFVRAARQTR